MSNGEAAFVTFVPSIAQDPGFDNGRTKQANGNKAEAARLLGIHRRLLYEKLGAEIL
jgi:hypothetical protein